MRWWHFKRKEPPPDESGGMHPVGSVWTLKPDPDNPFLQQDYYVVILEVKGDWVRYAVSTAYGTVTGPEFQSPLTTLYRLYSKGGRCA